ncbi:hypothetical protein COCSUDRAFT_67679 [Coccomyxa subellipsoidea C-169]|uniref:Uncharacterized protein n=1 Tax=Coccomyxa subellipsoidea (strain C-169) TaxID=574566 RepID=I0YMA7_COCSC|nr:hypothetical protein COCSUDRAFT_67679 [Coccomyxa subellipsoidea C-169]EIE19526.1 hypothetical protein COCSUDRAFT_67679 [Coccomyxa subellipsoidea C-169]|eukprot:XP_005644070.1 hypothetical protein COCSUDRAFT_67679 [Coccomyxa subellipsoidea C-169]
MPGSRQKRSMQSRRKQKAAQQRSKGMTWCFGPPAVVDEEPLMTVEEFRKMHWRRKRTHQQIQVLYPVHWLHPRAVMLQVLYDSLMGDPWIAPRVPPRLLDLLEYHRTLIFYDNEEDEEFYDDDSEQEEAQEGFSMAEDESYPAEDDEEVTQVLTRLASTGTAACRLDEAFGGEALAAAMEQEPELKDWMDHTEEEEAAVEEAVLPEEAELCEEEYGSPRETARDDASSCSESDYRALLGSPLRAAQDDMKRSASPKRHGMSQPVIKITATSSTVSSLNGPVPVMYSITETRDEARARLRGNAQRKEAAAAVDSEKKALAEAAGRASAAARVSAAQAAADADQADRNAPGRVELGALMDTMSTETGERNVNAAAQAVQGANIKALETVVEDTEAELARLNRSKVANMVKMYQGLEESNSRHTSPRIGARKSPLPSEKFSEPLIPKHPIATPDSPSREPLTPRGYTSRYLSAVQAATNTVSTWLQGGGTDEVSSPIAAAAEQLRDEHPFKSGHSQAMPPATPPKRGVTETATFSTPSAQLFDTNPIYDDVNERTLWSPFNSSFSSDYCAFGGGAAGRPRRNPELAARHAAAAARHAAAAARHANAAAKFAGLRMRSSPKDGRRRSHAGNGPLYSNVMDTRTTDNDMAHFPDNVMSTVDNMLFEP